MGQGDAQRLINVIRQAVNQETRSASKVDFVLGVVAATYGNFADIYLDGNTDTASENFRVPANLYVNVGDPVVVAIDYGSNLGKWINEVLPVGLFSLLAINPNTGQIFTSDGDTEPEAGVFGLTDHTHESSGAGPDGGGNTLNPVLIDFLDVPGDTSVMKVRKTGDSQERLAHGIDFFSQPFFSFGPGTTYRDVRVTRNGTKRLLLDDTADGAATLEVTGQVDLREHAAPGTPASGKGTLYAATDHTLHWKDSTGADSPVGSIANDSVTYAKMQNVSATNRVLGRITSGAGDPEELTAANVKTILGLAQADITGLTTADSPQLAGVNVGHASDTTIGRTGAGVINVEGKDVYMVGGADVAVADGGTGSGTAAGAATNLGLGTGDSPQFTGVNVGHATDTTLTRLGAGRLAVEGKELAVWDTIIIKPADESVTTSTTIQNDDDFFFTTVNLAHYEFQMVILYVNTGGSVGDLKMDFGEDSNSRGAVSSTGLNASDAAAVQSAITNQTDTIVLGVATGERTAILQGAFRGAGGTWRMRWAQQTSGSTTKILTGSVFRYRRIV